MDFAAILDVASGCDDFNQSPQLFIEQLDKIDDLGECQEELGRRLDEVEGELMEEVARHAAVFTDSLAVVQEVQESLSGLATATAEVSTQLSDYNTRMSTQYECLSSLLTQQQNLQSLLSALDRLSAILKTRRRIQELVDLCSFEDALFLIHKVEAQIVAEGFEEFAPLDLLRADLGEMKVALEKMRAAASAVSTKTVSNHT